MRKFLFLAVAALVAMASCTKNGNESEQNDEITIADNKTAVKIMKEGGDLEIKFSSKSDWTASSNAEWVMMGTESGKAGENTLAMFIEAFESENETDTRTADVTITSAKGAKAVIKITQYASGSIAPRELNFTKDGGELEFIVYSPDEVPHVEWQGEEDGKHPEVVPDWAQLIKPAAAENGMYTYKVIAKPNTTGKDRTAIVQPCFAGTCNAVMVSQKGN